MRSKKIDRPREGGGNTLMTRKIEGHYLTLNLKQDEYKGEEGMGWELIVLPPFQSIFPPMPYQLHFVIYIINYFVPMDWIDDVE